MGGRGRMDEGENPHGGAGGGALPPNHPSMGEAKPAPSGEGIPPGHPPVGSKQ